MRKGLLLLMALAASCLIVVTYRFSREEFMVDRCLSAQHGSFDYSLMSCDLEENHPYVPYQVRHPYDKRIALVALASLMVILLGYRYVANRHKGT